MLWEWPKTVAPKMLWTSVFLIALVIGQVPAKSTKKVEADFIENVSGGDSRIVSGWEAQLGQHPHHCNLRLVNAAGQLAGCGGSIVHNNWVITAAHCTALRVSIVIRAGLVFINDALEIQESTEWYNHPTYVDEMVQFVQPNDISLIKLPRSIVFNEYLRPIRVQPRADAFRDYEDLVLYASGHGRTWTGGDTPEALQWVYLRGISNPNCQRVFGTAIITDNAICAQYFNVTSQSTCQGDSGGPLVFEDNGVPTLIGVTSFVAGEAHGGCHSGFPAGFIRPGPFHEWFTLVTGFDFELMEETTTKPPTTTTTEAPEEESEESGEEPEKSEEEPEDSEENSKESEEKPKESEEKSDESEEEKGESEEKPGESEEKSDESEEEKGESQEKPGESEEKSDESEEEKGESEEKPKESEEDSKEPEESDSDGDDSSDGKDDPEFSNMLKRMEVQVNVKVKMSKLGSHKVHHNKTKTHKHKH